MKKRVFVVLMLGGALLLWRLSGEPELQAEGPVAASQSVPLPAAQPDLPPTATRELPELIEPEPLDEIPKQHRLRQMAHQELYPGNATLLCDVSEMVGLEQHVGHVIFSEHNPETGEPQVMSSEARSGVLLASISPGSSSGVLWLYEFGKFEIFWPVEEAVPDAVLSCSGFQEQSSVVSVFGTIEGPAREHDYVAGCGGHASIEDGTFHLVAETQPCELNVYSREDGLYAVGPSASLRPVDGQDIEITLAAPEDDDFEPLSDDRLEGRRGFLASFVEICAREKTAEEEAECRARLVEPAEAELARAIERREEAGM